MGYGETVIPDEKTPQAFGAIHDILVDARLVAYDSGDQLLIRLLDTAEILPEYCFSDMYDTHDFLEGLRQIVRLASADDRIIAGFLSDTPPNWSLEEDVQ